MSVAVMPSPIDIDGAHNKRKRSRSPSPKNDGAPPTSRRRSYSPPSNGPLLERPRVVDADPQRKAERERQLAARAAAAELEKGDKPKEEKEFDAQAEFAKLISSRSGGVYMPPARLRAMQEAAAKDKSSPEYQRVAWDALRKSITGIVNRVNIVNIKQVVPELFSENLIRGRGLFARSVMKAQAASLPFTPVFAALVAIINTKLPQVGELVLMRLISQFRRAFKRNDKIVCNSSTTFLAHLVNQAVAPPIVALQIFMLLLEHPTDDSIEIAVSFMREVGAFLTENSPKGTTFVFERFRAVLNEGAISQRVQYMIEVLMQVRKDKFKDNPIMPEGLDLVDEDEQITHQIELEDDLQVQEGLNVFKLDPDYLENEEKYKSIKSEILGEESDEESESEEESSDEDENEVAEAKEGIEDRTETNLVNLRRVIYLTIMNALNYEEAVHKLLKVQIDEGQEIELVNMIIECCSQERSYSTFYGLVGERLSKLNRVWTECFENAFGNYYTTIHRYETNRLRNIARFFGHLFATDSISWVVFECVKVNEDDTTSSSRIFIKILMNEMMESMGLKALAERFKDPEVKRSCESMFPVDVPKNTRFAINYFTSIGLGIITEEMREYLKVRFRGSRFREAHCDNVFIRTRRGLSWSNDGLCSKQNLRLQIPQTQTPPTAILIPTLLLLTLTRNQMLPLVIVAAATLPPLLVGVFVMILGLRPRGTGTLGHHHRVPGILGRHHHVVVTIPGHPRPRRGVMTLVLPNRDTDATIRGLLHRAILGAGPLFRLALLLRPLAALNPNTKAGTSRCATTCPRKMAAVLMVVAFRRDGNLRPTVESVTAVSRRDTVWTVRLQGSVRLRHI
ncbi:pre-mRNA-splicing factor cwc22 [Termitomyces sp. T159_Od127]|nr:pre-mRNA-splicing factor cwc22 [Termitomyces sp. T159_Od127]